MYNKFGKLDYFAKDCYSNYIIKKNNTILYWEKILKYEKT